MRKMLTECQDTQNVHETTYQCHLGVSNIDGNVPITGGLRGGSWVRQENMVTASTLTVNYQLCACLSNELQQNHSNH